MADWTEATGSIIARTAITHSHATLGIATGTPLATEGTDSVTLHMRWCGLEAAANTNPGFFMVLGSRTTGNSDWSLLDIIETNATTPATERLSNDSESGPVIEISSTAGFTQGNGVYCQDVVTEGNSDWKHIIGMVANTSVTIDSALSTALNGATDSDVMWTPADNFVYSYDVSALAAINVLFSHQGDAGADGIIQVDYRAATAFA